MDSVNLSESIAQRRQAAKMRDFLSHFAVSGNVLASAKQAGVSRQLVYYWREQSPAFEEKLSAAAGKAFGERERLAGSQQCRPKAARRGTNPI